MEKLTPYNPTVGDNLGFNTMRYENIPNGFRFTDLSFPTDSPLTYALKDKLVDFADKYYRNYEIVGTTFTDFFTSLQLDLLENIDTMEKMLAVYDEDIAKPTQSRTIKRTYDLVDTTDQTGENTSNNSSENTSVNTDYDIPYDNGASPQGVGKSEGTGSTTNTGKNTNKSNGTATKKGTETEDWSDVGVAPNYTLLNGFLDNNRTYYNVFVSFFKDDFTMEEYYYG